MESVQITSIDKYLASHPGATLQEYRDWVKAAENRVREQSNEEQRLFDEWLHEQDGNGSLWILMATPVHLSSSVMNKNRICTIKLISIIRLIFMPMETL